MSARKARCTDGQSTVEYVIIVILIAVVAVFFVRSFGKSTRCQFSNATGEISGHGPDGECLGEPAAAEPDPLPPEPPSPPEPPQPPSPPTPTTTTVTSTSTSTTIAQECISNHAFCGNSHWDPGGCLRCCQFGSVCYYPREVLPRCFCSY